MASNKMKMNLKPLKYLGGFVLLSTLGGCASLTGTPLAYTGSTGNDANTKTVKTSDTTLSIAELASLPLTPSEQTAAKKASIKAEGLWEVIRNDYGMPMETTHPRVQRAVAMFTRYPHYLTKVSARAKPYLPYIVAQLKRRHMPLALALLPIVESGYDPYAYSSSAAGGLWQFTPGTARHFGVRMNWWYDGRRSLYASTNAALDYLEQLHQRFGSWYLALAAYNSGAGTVQWAINYNKARGLPTDYWALPLPAQTQFYVPKLVALMEIFSDPARYHIKLVDIPVKNSLEVVPLHHQIDLNLAARLAGVSLTKLRELNPGYSRWATPPDGSYNLVLPRTRAAVFLKRLQSTPTTDRVTWVRQQVQSGDTLSGFAARYGTTVAVLRRINGLRSNLIRVGQSLLLPQGTVAYATAQAPTTTPPLHYRVRSGDSLWSIANQYGLTIADLRRWNNLPSGHLLHVGEVLRLRPTRNVTQQAHILQATYVKPARATGKWKNITVSSGQTLWSIAQKYHTSYAALAKWNDLNPNKMLSPGMKLAVYDITSVKSSAATSGPPVVASDRATSANTVKAKASVIVRSGDTLWSIAQQEGVSPKQIAAWNNIPVDAVLHPGMRLWLHLAPNHNAVPSAASRPLKTVIVRPGDSLWSIAAAHNMPVERLVQINDIKPNQVLRPGMQLRI